MKFDLNMPCPCGSGKKYKKCCHIYHKDAVAQDALTLMKSRYSAYVVHDANYLIKTTHPKSPYFTDDKKSWKRELQKSFNEINFISLEIVSTNDSDMVEFKAYFEGGIHHEKSRFALSNGKLYYLDGVFI